MIERELEVRRLTRAAFRRAARQAVYVMAIASATAGATLAWNGLTIAGVLVWLDLFTADTIRLAVKEVARNRLLRPGAIRR